MSQKDNDLQKQLLRQKVAVSRDSELKNSESKTTTEGITQKVISEKDLQKAKEFADDIVKAVTKSLKTPAKNQPNTWNVAHASSAKSHYNGDIVGNSEEAQSLTINFTVTRGEVLSRVSEVIANNCDDLVLQEKLERVIQDHKESLFFLQKGRTSYSSTWHLGASPQNMDNFLRAVKRTIVLHKSELF